MNCFLILFFNVIMSWQGIIDKYMGDVVMVFWNVLLQDDCYVYNVCEVVLEMVCSFEIVNVEWKGEVKVVGEDFLCLNVGIGINIGECVVGNMGFEFWFDYLVLGDDVNLVLCLEGQFKVYGVIIIVGDVMVFVVGRDFVLVEIDKIQVKGKQELVCIYCLFGDSVKVFVFVFQVDKMVFGDFLMVYRGQDWLEV